MSLQMTTYALGTNATWPFVTLPRFEAQAALARKQTKAGFLIALQSFVTNQNRLAWEKYAVKNQGWVQEGLDYLGIHKNASRIPPYITKDTVNFTREDRSADPYYAPVWQCSPVNTNEQLINYNAYDFSFFANVTKRILQAKKAVLSEVINLTPNDPNWPQSFMAAPIYGDVNEDSPLVGVLTAILPWHNNFLNLVPNGINGLQVVVRNTCDQEFTYQVNGPNVEYLGIGDLHDPTYDDLEVSAPYEAFTSTTFCQFSLHIYPSNEFRAEYISNMPKIYTGAVVLIFVLTAFVFILYDCLVERRQQKVMTSAVRTNAIVVSEPDLHLPSLLARPQRILQAHTVPVITKKRVLFSPQQLEIALLIARRTNATDKNLDGIKIQKEHPYFLQLLSTICKDSTEEKGLKTALKANL